MKKYLIILLLGTFPFCVQAQLAQQMSKHHEKTGITITLLDKSLYGLYQQENLSAATKEMLQKLDEVNILNIDLKRVGPGVGNEVITQFKNILEHPNKYKLVKSRTDDFNKQLIYAQNKNGKVSDLVVWNQTPGHLDIIEIRGNIQLEQIASLSRALNLSGLNPLTTLSGQQKGNKSSRP